MANSHATTPKNRSADAQSRDCYDRLVSEIATLECVRATLSEWDQSDRDDKSENISSAELVLTNLIKRLYGLARDVEKLQDLVEGEVAHG
jgi:hypothetical protein